MSNFVPFVTNLDAKRELLKNIKVLFLISILLLIRSTAENYLRGKKNGTFLCRPSSSAKADNPTTGRLHTHTIDVVYVYIVLILNTSINMNYDIMGSSCQF